LAREDAAGASKKSNKCPPHFSKNKEDREKIRKFTFGMCAKLKSPH
jgi:hypothetical protein